MKIIRYAWEFTWFKVRCFVWFIFNNRSYFFSLLKFNPIFEGVKSNENNNA